MPYTQHGWKERVTPPLIPISRVDKTPLINELKATIESLSSRVAYLEALIKK